MRFWIDTEFYENGRTIELISLGAVSEEGKTFYAQTPNARELASSSEWLSKNVYPYLSRDAGASRWLIAQRLVECFGEKPEIWGYYSAYDWVAICQLFGTMMDLPPGWPMYCRDVQQWADQIGIAEIDVPQEREHHALADAEWTKKAWEWLRLRNVGPI